MIYLMADWLFSSTFTEVIKVLLSIDSIIYWLIAQFFAFIIDVASSEFVMSDLVNAIINRTYIVVGVFALFIMSYSLIKGMFDPDGAFKGKNSIGSIVKNLLIAIALVALMPTIFQYLFRFQTIIVNNNVIGAIVLGSDNQNMEFVKYVTDEEGNVQFKEDSEGNKVPETIEYTISANEVGYENYVKVAANNVAFSAMNAFIYADDDTRKIDLSEKVTAGTFLSPITSLGGGIHKTIKSVYQDVSGENWTNFNIVKNNIIISGNFLEINSLSYHIATGGDYANGEGAHVSYMFVVSTIGGIVMLVLAFTFCINLVIRMFNLFLLELVSPIASFSLIIPNSKIFNNWLKAVMKEYLDIFIRLFTFNLAILFFSNVQSIISQTSTISSGFNLLNLFFVIGLLIFINEAPKLIKDIFGIKESKKLKDRLFTGAVASTIGGALGLAGGLAGSAIGATHALADKETKGLHKAWNTVKGVGSGVSTGQAAAKSKKFSDFTGAVGKGVTATDTNRKKGDLYYRQHGSSLGGVIKGKASDAFKYATGVNPSNEWKQYKDQKTAAVDLVNDTVKNLEESVDKSKVFTVGLDKEGKRILTSNVDTITVGNRTFNKDVDTLKNLVTQQEVKRNEILAGNSQLLTKELSKNDWITAQTASIDKAMSEDTAKLRNDYANEMAMIRSFDETINGDPNIYNEETKQAVAKQKEDYLNERKSFKAIYDDYNKQKSERQKLTSQDDSDIAEINEMYNNYQSKVQASNDVVLAQAESELKAAKEARDSVIAEAIEQQIEFVKGGKTNIIYSEAIRKIDGITSENEYAYQIKDENDVPYDLRDKVNSSKPFSFKELKQIKKDIKRHAEELDQSPAHQAALSRYRENIENKDK